MSVWSSQRHSRPPPHERASASAGHNFGINNDDKKNPTLDRMMNVLVGGLSPARLEVTKLDLHQNHKPHDHEDVLRLALPKIYLHGTNVQDDFCIDHERIDFPPPFLGADLDLLPVCHL